MSKNGNYFDYNMTKLSGIVQAHHGEVFVKQFGLEVLTEISNYFE